MLAISFCLARLLLDSSPEVERVPSVPGRACCGVVRITPRAELVSLEFGESLLLRVRKNEGVCV